jgi:hypothetical protein
VLRKITLSPEGFGADDLVRMARQCVADWNRSSGKAAGSAVLNVTLHSPSCEPGHTPYVRTADDQKAFLTTLSKVLQFCVRELGARPLTMREYRDELVAEANGHAPLPGTSPTIPRAAAAVKHS